MEFSDLAPLKDFVRDHLDHASLLRFDDPLLAWLKSDGQKVFATQTNPTSEHLAEILLKTCQNFFEKNSVRVISVEVAETCTAAATARP